MADGRSTSTISSSEKRKRAPAPGFYAVKVGHTPGIYYSWEDTKEQTRGYKNAIFKKFNSLADAEDFMKNENLSTAKPGKAKFYGVRAGHRPGVYTDYPSVLEQVTGFKGGKQKSFATWEEAQAYVNEGKTATPSDTSTPISLKGHLTSRDTSVVDSRKSSKKLKKNDGTVAVPDTNGYFEPGTGLLPLDAEDGFDDAIFLPRDGNDGTLQYKTEEQRNARKWQPTGEFSGPLKIWTDGASKGNGQVGSVAGFGIWFGPIHANNVKMPLLGDNRQTNQRAELTAIARAIDIAPIDRSAIIYTDSNYSIRCVTEWCKRWVQTGWRNAAGKPVENKDIIEPILARIEERKLAGAFTEFKWVKGHASDEGNIGADALANDGASEAKILDQMGELKTEAAAEAARNGVEKSREYVNGILGISPKQVESVGDFGEPDLSMFALQNY